MIATFVVVYVGAFVGRANRRYFMGRRGSRPMPVGRIRLGRALQARRPNSLAPPRGAGTVGALGVGTLALLMIYKPARA